MAMKVFQFHIKIQETLELGLKRQEAIYRVETKKEHNVIYLVCPHTHPSVYGKKIGSVMRY